MLLRSCRDPAWGTDGKWGESHGVFQDCNHNAQIPCGVRDRRGSAVQPCTLTSVLFVHDPSIYNIRNYISMNFLELTFNTQQLAINAQHSAIDQ